MVLVLAFVQDNTNGGILTGEGGSAAGDAPRETSDEPLLARADADGSGARPRSGGRPAQPPHTLFSGMRACLDAPILVFLSLGWAAIIGKPVDPAPPPRAAVDSLAFLTRPLSRPARAGVVASVGTFGGAFVVALQVNGLLIMFVTL